MTEKNTKKTEKLDFKTLFDIIDRCKDFSEVSLSVEKDKISLHFKNNQEKPAGFSSQNQNINETPLNESDDEFSEERLNKLKAEHALMQKEQLIFDDPMAYMTGEEEIPDNE
jgi:hypothetical protein